jgi:hypothetical protein
LILAHQNLGQLRKAGEDIYHSVMAIPNRLVFGSLSTEDAVVLADEMFCGEFDLERPKLKHTTPVTVGYRPIWLESQGTTRSHADFANMSETETESEGENGPANFRDVPTDDHVRASSSRARASGSGSGSTDSESTNEGRSQAMHPILEERPSHLYTLEELKHDAAARLKDLAPGIAIAKIIGRKPLHVAIPLPKPGLDQSGLCFRAWKKRLLESSPHIVSAAQADAEIAERALRLGVEAPAPSTPSAPPVYGRRVARSRTQTKQ